MLKQKIDFNKVRKIIINRRIDKLRLEGKDIETGIITRTQKGVDVKLKKFRKYSKKTKKLRKELGRKTSKVDLTMSGNMLHAIRSKKIKGGLRFYFISKVERDKAHSNQKRGRKFFGLDKLQKKSLNKALSRIRQNIYKG